MPEMNPDPITKLAQFTPDGGAVDTAELLFAAGRASAHTPRVWKIAVAGLLLANAVCVGLLVFRSGEAPPVAQPAPERQQVPAAPAEAPAPASPDPWSYQALRDRDPDRLPQTSPVAGYSEPRPTLTALSGRRGELD